MAVDAGSAVGYLDLDISGFLANLRTAQSEADKTTSNMATKIGNNISGIGKSLTSVGTTLTKNVTVPLTAVGVAGLKVATDFEKGMSEVKAISGATGDEFDALREKAIELGADTAFSAGEVAEAMVEMAKAGWDSQQIIDGMSGVLAAAAASGEGLASVSTIVADAITGFGLAASDSTKVADLLTQAANSGTIGISDLGESFKYIAPVAGAMGLSIEDVTTALSAMSMSGIKGSQAGTALRTMLTNLVKPTDDMAAAMEELGIEVANTDGTMKPLDEIIGILRESFSGLTDEQKSYYAALLAGKTGMSGMLSLLNLTEEEYNAIAESMDNAGGVAEETAAVMQDNLQSKVEQLGGALESLAIKLADHVIPYLQKFVVWLTSLVDKFAALDPETQKTILKFAGIAAAAGPVLTVIGKLVSGVGGMITTFGKIPGAISKVQTVFTALGTKLINVKEGFVLAKNGMTALGAQASPLGAALAGITGPMIAIVAAIALVVAAFVSLWKNNEEFRNKITAIWDQIKATFEKLTSGIVERLNRLGFDFESIGEVLKAIWKGFCDFLAPIFEGVFQYIANTFDTFVNVFLGIWDFFHALFTGDWEGCWNAVKGIFESIWNGIKDWFTNILNVITGVFDVVCGWFGTTWSDTWNSIKTFFVGLWEGIVSWFQGVLTGISTFFTNIWTGISTFFTGLWNGIVSFFTNTLNSIKTTFETIWNGISTFFTNIWNTIKNVVQVGIMFIVELFNAAFQLITLPFRFIWENCKETIMSIWNTIKTTISTALTTIQTTISNVWTAVSNFFVSIWTSISTFVSTIWNQISTTVSTIINAIKTTVTNVFNSIKTTITNIFNAIKTTITNVLNAISTFISTIWNAIKTTITNVVNAVKTTITNVFNAVKTTVTNVFNSIKSTTTNVWNGIKTAITTPLNAAKTTISNVVNSVKTTISNGFNAAKNTVTNVFNSIKNSISNVMNSAKTAVKNAINNIKSKFNFSWSLPKLKMPHPKISGSFSLNPPSVPKFSIEWYKKAMGNGMILDAPTIFGFNSKTGKFLAGGEAGSETVVGTKSLMNMIRTAVKESNSEVIKTIVSYFDVVLNNIRSANENLAYSISRLVDASYQFAHSCDELGYIAYNGFTKAKDSYERNKSSNKDNGGGGDTFIFNSPKAIDEIEAAKQMKQTKRELAEGF